MGLKNIAHNCDFRKWNFLEQFNYISEFKIFNY